MAKQGVQSLARRFLPMFGRLKVRQRISLETVSSTTTRSTTGFENHQTPLHFRLYSSSMAIQNSSPDISDENLSEVSPDQGRGGNSRNRSSRRRRREKRSAIKEMNKAMEEMNRSTTKDTNRSTMKDMEAFTRKILQDQDIEGRSTRMAPESVHKIISCVRYWTSTRMPKGIENGRHILLSLLNDLNNTESPNEQLCNDVTLILEHFILHVRKHEGPDELAHVVLDLIEFLEKQRQSNGLVPIKPTLKMYNIAIDAIAKSRRKDSIKEIEDIIERMETYFAISPDATSYNTLLYAFSQQTRNGAAKCEAFLRELQDNPETRKHVDVISYNVVMNAWSKTDYAWAKNNAYHAANQAESLLREMQNEYSKGRLQLKPTLVSFTTAIDAWSRISSKDLEAAQRAENILNLLDELSESDSDLRPNAFTFHAVMNAWSKSSLPNSAKQVENLLDKMIDRFNAGNHSLKPGKISFSIAITAWAAWGDNKGDSTQALRLLEQMQMLSRKGYDTMPDIGTFNSVLRAIANGNEEADKLNQLEMILKQIESLKLQPDLHTHNTVLRCCVTTRSNDSITKKKAVRIATETLLRIQKTPQMVPDPFTFNFFIKVCDRHTTGGEKLKLVKVAFQYCKESGQFSAPVLSLMKNALTPQELLVMLRIDDAQTLQSMNIEDFPAEWRRGVNNSHNDRSRRSK